MKDTGIKWYIVELMPDMKDRRGGSAYSASRQHEIVKWLEENWTYGIISVWIPFGTHSIGFAREEDAFAFKLRWA